MAVSGVITITSQIMQAEEDNPASTRKWPGLSAMMRKVVLAIKNMKQNFRKLGGAGAMGIFYGLLSQSRIASTMVKNMFRLAGTFVDIILSEFGIIKLLGWAIPKIADIVRFFGDFMNQIGPVLRGIWDGIWSFLQNVVRAAGRGLINAFKDFVIPGATDDEVDGLMRMGLGVDEGGTLVTASDTEEFLKPGGGGGPHLTDEAITQEDIDELSEYYEGQLNYPTEEELEQVRASYAPLNVAEEDPRGPPTWMHEEGPKHPPGGRLYAWQAEVAMRDGTIQIIDERLDEGSITLDSETEEHHSWKDNLKPFEWSDLADNLSLEKLNPFEFINSVFGGSEGTSATADSKDIVTALIDRTVEGPDGSLKNPFEAHLPDIGLSGNRADESQYGGGREAMQEQALDDQARRLLEAQYAANLKT
jgi:hypothetical protein